MWCDLENGTHVFEKRCEQQLRTHIEWDGTIKQASNIVGCWKGREGGRPGQPVSTPYFRQCKNGAGLWEVLQLEDNYTLDKYLQVSKVRRFLCWTYISSSPTQSQNLRVITNLQVTVAALIADGCYKHPLGSSHSTTAVHMPVGSSCLFSFLSPSSLLLHNKSRHH